MSTTTVRTVDPAAPVPAAPLSRAVTQGPYTVSLATGAEQLRAAQRLRCRVFAEEFGAELSGPEAGVDSDRFDPYCDHLLVTENRTGEVVGTYRLLPPGRVAAAGGRYSEGEFDLGALAPIGHDLVETGRSCVHPDHRDGAVIALMWAGIARYLTDSGHNWLVGCCSIPLADGGRVATAVRRRTAARHLAPPEYRVTPHRPWSPGALVPPQPGSPHPAAEAELPPLPPLLRGYLRLGAWVCGEPAHDPEFGAADFLVLLSLRDMNPRYLRHFLGLADAGTAGGSTGTGGRRP